MHNRLWILWVTRLFAIPIWLGLWIILWASFCFFYIWFHGPITLDIFLALATDVCKLRLTNLFRILQNTRCIRII